MKGMRTIRQSYTLYQTQTKIPKMNHRPNIRDTTIKYLENIG